MSDYRLMFAEKDRMCRCNYTILREEFAEHGIDPGEVIKSRALACNDGTSWWVDKAAFYPTGVALGCSLPDAAFSNILFQATNAVAQAIEPFLQAGQAHFSFVPESGYHVTLVNYSHFDCAETSEQVVLMDTPALCKVKEYFQRVRHPMPRIQFKGLILTRSGRLIVPGYAVDITAFAIRADLAKLNPRFETNLPKTLHIKLGHFLRNLNPGSQDQCLEILDEIGAQIDSTLAFGEVFTPLEVLREIFS
jgi:hypothetical protein